MGLEPTTFGTTIRHSNRLSYIHRFDRKAGTSRIGVQMEYVFLVCARISLENYSFRRVQEPAEPTESISAGTIREAGFFRQNIPTMFRVDRPASPNAAGRKAPPLAAGGRSQAFTGTSAVRRTAHPRSAHLSNGSGELSRRRISQNDASEFPFAPRFPPLRLHPGRRAPAEPNRSFVSVPCFSDFGCAEARRSAMFE